MARKLISLSFQPEQEELLDRVMAANFATNRSAFIVSLLVEKEAAGNKRGPGRPKSGEADASNPEDDVRKYCVDWPVNKNFYSYNDLVDYYDYDPRRGEMPKRGDLKLHPEWVKANPQP